MGAPAKGRRGPASSTSRMEAVEAAAAVPNSGSESRAHDGPHVGAHGPGRRLEVVAKSARKIGEFLLGRGFRPADGGILSLPHQRRLLGLEFMKLGRMLDLEIVQLAPRRFFPAPLDRAARSLVAGVVIGGRPCRPCRRVAAGRLLTLGLFPACEMRGEAHLGCIVFRDHFPLAPSAPESVSHPNAEQEGREQV